MKRMTKHLFDKIVDFKSNFWWLGFLTSSLDWMREYPATVNEEQIAALSRELLSEGRLCSNIQHDCPEDQDRAVFEPTLTPDQLTQAMLALQNTFPETLASAVNEMCLLVWSIGGSADLEHFWVPFVHGITGENQLHQTPGFTEFLTGLLYTYATKYLGPQPPSEPDDLGWPVEIGSEMQDFWTLLADDTRQEASFQWTSEDRARMLIAPDLPRLEVSMDESTKPATVLLRKISRADPEHHASWAERKNMSEPHSRSSTTSFCGRSRASSTSDSSIFPTWKRRISQGHAQSLVLYAHWWKDLPWSWTPLRRRFSPTCLGGRHMNQSNRLRRHPPREHRVGDGGVSARIYHQIPPRRTELPPTPRQRGVPGLVPLSCSAPGSRMESGALRTPIHLPRGLLVRGMIRPRN